MGNQTQKVYRLLENSPVFRTNEATDHGIHRKTLHRLVEQGRLIRIARGLYADPNHVPGTYQSMIEAQKAVPQGVLCLLSALVVHQIGTQNPRQIWTAIPRGTRPPQAETLPILFVRYSATTFNEGIESHTLDGVDIRVFNIPRTIADCFKFRNRIGLDVAIEALKDVVSDRRTTNDQILHFAKICRVESVITPYLESLQ